jgi:ligand-binding sensor domain-containing protein
LLGVACLSLGAGAGAQSTRAGSEYLVDRWEMEQGLPENFVNAIAQTPDGYLWCGTPRGLARFDGARFKIFDRANTPALGSAFIIQLLVDGRGTL